MTQATYDVLGVGNAIVDILAQADEAFLDKHGMAKGGMTLVDEDQAHAIYAAMGAGVEASGGSAGNTIAGVASFGGKAAFIGRVKDDEFGKIFAHDLRSLGVAFDTPAAKDGPATARCLVLVTSDAQRTMNTHLGACVELTEEDIDPALVAAAQITYLEGYLFDPPRAKEAFRKAARLAREAGRKVALTLSDSFCVHRYHDEFLELISDHVDILFANEAEIEALYPGASLAEAAAQLAAQVEIAAITRSEKGSLLLRGSERAEVAAQPIAKLVDTTGAGDLYAAGVLFGLTRGKELAECGRLGSIAAAEVISHYGARPEVSLAGLV
ncbi:MAG: adenosine kinase [Novosphingobium sp.]|nr:adenosine kinase [Novosphingobium sp.]MBO9604240.1 adenosine kinase [Novosphingobium sp.]